MRELYENPLISRYASKAMAQNFSDEKKFKTWRRLWVALAEAEMELGLPITPDQVEELRRFQDDINYNVAAAREREVRHDVMSHVYAYGVQCPSARAIIHLGATSCYVGDNADILIMRDALSIVLTKLVNCMAELAKFAMQYKDMPTLGFTHFQPAQLTTVGKRACLWLQDLLMDLEELEHVISILKMRGVKGTTGTQASFLTLFDGDHEKVKELEKRVAAKMGLKACFAVTGQTYPRKLDAIVLSQLSGIAQSAYKFADDIRLLQNMKEIEEPFEKSQIGSSAMAYKRNPMRSERICSLSRFVMANSENAAMTAATQWLERTLDDSANKRLAVPQAFLAVDAILNIYLNVVDGLVVYPKMVEKHVRAELPFMATETILMEAVRRGGDRQELHERIRVHSMEAGRRVKMEGMENDLLSRIAADPAFGLTLQEIDELLDAKRFTGRAEQQVEEFVAEEIQPILDHYKAYLGLRGEVNL